MIPRTVAAAVGLELANESFSHHLGYLPLAAVSAQHTHVSCLKLKLYLDLQRACH